MSLVGRSLVDRLLDGRLRVSLLTTLHPADGVEPVETMEPGAIFEGKIIIEPKEMAIEEAKKCCAGLVMWTD